MTSYLVLGAGLSGLATAALLASAGNKVTVLERNDWIGGKSRRIELLGQRMDTGPALLTFPGVLEEIYREYSKQSGKDAFEIAPYQLQKLNEVGEYFFRGERFTIPFPAAHPLASQWQRFESEHSALAPAIQQLLTQSSSSPAALKAALELARVYGRNLTTQKYLDSLGWMSETLKELIAIHTLNAGVGPEQTLALYASVTAIMSSEGISVPVGGVNEIAQNLAKLAQAAGAEIHLNQKVTAIRKGSVTTELGQFKADKIVSSLDQSALDPILGISRRWPARSCSGVAIYAVLKQNLPENFVTHSVVMPDSGAELHASLQANRPPRQTMAFLNYYRPGQIYPNTKPTVAVLLTAPADGLGHDLNSEWVRAELDRISDVVGLSEPIDELFEDYLVLNPEYFGSWGGPGGALYGKTRKLWQSGPFHIPRPTSLLRPWLIRVGAAIHPGGGMPAVLGGALRVSRQLLSR